MIDETIGAAKMDEPFMELYNDEQIIHWKEEEYTGIELVIS
jgi:hypothetical protein